MPLVLQPGTRLTLEVIAATDLRPSHTLWGVTDNRGYHLWTEGVPITTTPTPHGERWLNADQHLIPADSWVLIEARTQRHQRPGRPPESPPAGQAPAGMPVTPEGTP